jgi:hypothetical protein
MQKEACVTINVKAKEPVPPVTPPVTPEVPVTPPVTPEAPTAWAPVLMSALAGVGLAVVGMILWPEE